MSHDLRPNPAAADLDRITSFFDRFDAAFATFEGAEVAARYAEPYVACNPDGSATSLATTDDIASYFQEILDAYHRLGVRSCTHSRPTLHPLGGPHSVATLTWRLLDSHAAVILTWTESYLVVDDGQDFSIRAATVHPSPQPTYPELHGG